MSPTTSLGISVESMTADDAEFDTHDVRFGDLWVRYSGLLELWLQSYQQRHCCILNSEQDYYQVSLLLVQNVVPAYLGGDAQGRVLWRRRRSEHQGRFSHDNEAIGSSMHV